MDLVDECPEDVKYAQLLSLQARRDAEDVAEEGLDNVKHQDIFQPASSKEKINIKSTKEIPTEKTARDIITKAANSESCKLLKKGGFGSPTALLALPGASKTTSIKDLGIVRKKTSSTVSSSASPLYLKKNNSVNFNNGTSQASKQSVLVTSTKSSEIIENNKNLHYDIQPEEKLNCSSLNNSCNPLQMLSNYSDSSEDSS
jgi:hypothetical protein